MAFIRAENEISPSLFRDDRCFRGYHLGVRHPRICFPSGNIYSLYLVDYSFGFMRRALAGELISIAFPQISKLTVSLISVLSILVAGALYYRLFRRDFGFGLNTLPLFALLLSSPFFQDVCPRSRLLRRIGVHRRVLRLADTRGGSLSGDYHDGNDVHHPRAPPPFLTLLSCYLLHLLFALFGSTKPLFQFRSSLSRRMRVHRLPNVLGRIAIRGGASATRRSS